MRGERFNGTGGVSPGEGRGAGEGGGSGGAALEVPARGTGGQSGLGSEVVQVGGFILHVCVGCGIIL